MHNSRTRTALNEAASRMASVMRERAAAAGNCTEDDLRAAGFSLDEIGALRDRAAGRAASVSVRVLR